MEGHVIFALIGLAIGLLLPRDKTVGLVSLLIFAVSLAALAYHSNFVSSDGGLMPNFSWYYTQALLQFFFSLTLALTLVYSSKFSLKRPV